MDKHVTHATSSSLTINTPTATSWHHLKLNGTTIELPLDELSPAHYHLSVNTQDGVCENAVDSSAFNKALTQAQERYADRLAAQARTLSSRAQALENPGTDNLDVCALSSYQRDQLRCELSQSLGQNLEFLCSDESEEIFKRSKTHISLEAHKDAPCEASLQIAGIEGVHQVICLDLIAHEGAQLTLTLELLNEAVLKDAMHHTPSNLDTCMNSPAEDTPIGSVSILIRLFAKAHSTVELRSLQALPTSLLSLDKKIIFADESADIMLECFDLGAHESYHGLGCDLRGHQARISCRLSHLATKNQLRDYDYLYQHHGEATQTDFDINGVLAGSSRKNLRATIDLITGCKQASGQEHESVLITDEKVSNRTLPVILCSEDDVSGNHGATIGHISPEQLFYLGCRGIDPQQSEALFISAKLEDAFMRFNSPEAQARIKELAQELLPSVDEEVYSL